MQKVNQCSTDAILLCGCYWAKGPGNESLCSVTVVGTKRSVESEPSSNKLLKTDLLPRYFVFAYRYASKNKIPLCRQLSIALAV